MLTFKQWLIEAGKPDYQSNYKQGSKNTKLGGPKTGRLVSALKVGDKIYHGHGIDHADIIDHVAKKVGGDKKFDNHADSGHIKFGYYNHKAKMFHHYDEKDNYIKDRVSKKAIVPNWSRS